jgi:hypothetical protein
MNRKTNFIIAGVAAMLLLAPAPASAQFGGLLKKAKQKVEKKVKQEVKDHIADRRGQIVGKIDQKVYEKKHNAEQKVKNKLYETEEELVDKAREKVTGLEPFEENFVNDGIRFIRFKPDEVEKIAAKMARKNRDDLAMTSPGGNIDWRYGIHMLDYPCDSLGPESLNDELMYWCFKFSYALYKKNPEKLAMAFHGLADPWNILVNKHDPKRTNYVDASEDELAIHFICTDWGKYIKARVDSYEKMLFTDKGYPAEEVSTEAWEWCINQVNKSPKGSALGGMYMIRITNIRKQLIIRDKISPSDPQWKKLEAATQKAKKRLNDYWLSRTKMSTPEQLKAEHAAFVKRKAEEKAAKQRAFEASKKPWPKTKMGGSKLAATCLAAYKVWDENGTDDARRVSVVSTSWKIERDALGNILRRVIVAYVDVKGDNGRKAEEHSFCQDYLGGGRYGKTRHYGVGLSSFYLK